MAALAEPQTPILPQSGPAKLQAGQPVGPVLQQRLDRGRKVMMRDAPKRRLCHKFERGDTYWLLNEKNTLVQQNTITFANGGGKPPHRIRNRYNFIRPLVDTKVSAASGKVPSYDVSPTTSDPKDISAAAVARKVAVFGFDKWRIREATKRAVKYAVVSGDAYAWPYFDPNVGPYVQTASGYVGTGEIKVRILSGNQVYYEPGVAFDDSRWWAVELALPIDEVRSWPGFDSRIKLMPDASTSDNPQDKRDTDNLVVVTCYFERPSVKYPTGRYFCIANKQVIVPETDYPLLDPKGNVLDEPILHRIKYTTDPESDHDLGLVWQLIDYQRTIQDCYNKLLEWKNRTLNPQMLAPENSMSERRNDIPGYVYYYKPVGNLKPEWEVPNPTFVGPLQEILEQAKRDMMFVAADYDFSNALRPNVASYSIQSILDQSSSRWAAFLTELAEWHSRVMRHCLLLAARYYTEPRLIQIRGERGVENVNDFLGANILDQVNVRVDPGTLESKTKTDVMQEVFAYFDRQMISPRQAMEAIHTRDTGALTYSSELDIQRANTIIARILDGTVMQVPDREVIDPTTGQPVTVPSWMPGPSDDADVWQQIFSDWMKTDQFENLQPQDQEVANLIYGGIIRQRLAKAQQEAQMQMAAAQNNGMVNAARPQGPNGSAGPPVPPIFAPAPRFPFGQPITPGGLGQPRH